MAEADDVVWMVRGAWVALCVRAACELGVVDLLDEPRTVDTLAAASSSDPPTLARLLRVLVDLDLLERVGDRYATTARGEVLRRGHPSGIRDLALMQTVAPNLTAWSHLADAVRQGSSVYEDLTGMTNWAWLEAHPPEEAVFNAAMARRATLQVEAISAACDLSAARLLVDVGGGKGAMLTSLLAQVPRAARPRRRPAAGGCGRDGRLRGRGGGGTGPRRAGGLLRVRPRRRRRLRALERAARLG